MFLQVHKIFLSQVPISLIFEVVLNVITQKCAFVGVQCTFMGALHIGGSTIHFLSEFSTEIFWGAQLHLANAICYHKS